MIEKRILVLTYRSKYKNPFPEYIARDYLMRFIFQDVLVYDYAEKVAIIGFASLNNEIIEIAERYKPNYAYVELSEYELFYKTLDNLRQKGIVVVGQLGDDEYRFDNYSKWWIPYLDYCITQDVEAVPKYKALGAKVIQTLPCAGVLRDASQDNKKKKYDVTFVGGIKSKPNRKYYIKTLQNNNIPVQVFGDDCSIPYETMIDTFADSKINLNFSRVTNSSRMGFKGRITEVCLAGGFLLTEYIPNISKYFDIDKEIVCFHDAEDLLSKVTYYLEHDDERQAIANSGWLRAKAEYTPLKMLQHIFSEIEEDIRIKDNGRV